MAEQWEAGLDDVAVFVAVVEAGGFTAAARRLGLRKSTVSRRVAQLEARLGVRLLERTTRAVRVTDLGDEYFRRCARAVAQVREADELLSRARAVPSGLLRVATTQAVAETMLPPVAAAFLERYPQARLEVAIAKRVVDLVSEGFDVALRIGGAVPPGLRRRRLARGAICYCASPAYLAAQGAPRAPADLDAHACIVLGEGDEPAEWPFVGPEGPARKAVRARLRTGSLWLAYHAVRAGLGIGRLPAPLAAEDLQRGRLAAVLEAYTPPEQPLDAVYAGRREGAPLLSAFLDQLEAIAGGRSLRAGAAPPLLPPGLGRPRQRPPLTRRFCPVIQRPSGPTRKPTTSATSAGWPSRPRGVCATMASRWCLGMMSPSVSVSPGETTLTVMPRGPSSTASAAAKRSTAALLPV
jgi:DNA-binding transcriptional LysR family regulator